MIVLPAILFCLIMAVFVMCGKGTVKCLKRSWRDKDYFFIALNTFTLLLCLLFIIGDFYMLRLWYGRTGYTTTAYVSRKLPDNKFIGKSVSREDENNTKISTGTDNATPMVWKQIQPNHTYEIVYRGVLAKRNYTAVRITEIKNNPIPNNF